jgi:Cu-Zn family superoxide dismutase
MFAASMPPQSLQQPRGNMTKFNELRAHQTKTARPGRATFLVIGCAALFGCASSMAPISPASPSSSTKAVAELKPTQGNSENGLVWFVQDGDHVNVTVRVSGLTPNQEHGFHLHEKGDCSSPDASSAGGHLNPMKVGHGPMEKEHHLGDFAALKADSAGKAQARFAVHASLLGSGSSDLVGKAAVIHANKDDYSTQPDGASGPRIACGVVLVPTNQAYPDAPKGLPSEM